MKLADWHGYLILHGADNGTAGSEISLVRDMTEAIELWDCRTRISPLYGLLESGIGSPRKIKFPQKSDLFFVGPAHPFDISNLLASLSDRCSAWMTIGAFNFVLHIPTEKDIRIVTPWLRHSKCRWERWRLQSNKILRTSYYKVSSAISDPWKESVTQLTVSASLPEFHNTVEEYRALICSAIARAQVVFPPLVSDLVSANEIVISRIRKANVEITTNEIAMVVDVNAALSRFSSQTFSGASPIRETECHFWTHSLLGIGVANIALANIRHFLKRTLGEARVPERVLRYKDIQHNVPVLTAKAFTDSVWSKAWIDEVRNIDNPAPLFPQITYFSGRDGFKTTETTLSAPLNAITSCSSTRWTLHTVTHEASHTIITGVLSVILPSFDDPDEVKLTAALINGQTAANLLEELCRYLLRIMVEMTEQADGIEAPDPLPATYIIDTVRRWRVEVEEIMVHTFDFLFFYGQQIDEYVQAIWRSWDTIPHLNSKLHEYLIRTLCVATSRHLDAPNTFSAAREDTKRALAAVVDVLRPTSYVYEALNDLTESERDSHQIEEEVQVRLGLIAIVKSFLHSPKLLQEVRGRSGGSRRADADRSHASSEMEFISSRIDNPLAFIEEEVSLDANESRSFWILQRLAFDSE